MVVGWDFFLIGSISFLGFLYAAVISKLLPSSDIAVISAIQNDWYYCFLVPLTIPILIVSVLLLLRVLDNSDSRCFGIFLLDVGCFSIFCDSTVRRTNPYVTLNTGYRKTTVEWRATELAPEILALTK